MSLLLLLWLVSALPVEAGDGAAATSPANIPGDYTTGEHSGRESSQTVSEQHLRIPNAAYGERDRLQYQLGELGCKHKRLENEIMMRRSCLVNYDATKGGSNYAEALTKYAKTLSDMADVATQMRDVCLQMARQQEAEVMPPGGGRGHTGCSSSSSAQSGSAEETTGRGAAPVPSEWAPAGFHPAHATVGFWVCDASVGSWAWVPGGLQPVEQVWAQQQAGCGSVAGSCGPQHGMEYVCPNNGIIAPTELGTTGGDAEGVRVSRSLPMRKEDVNAEVSQCGMRASAAPFVPVPSLNREIVVPEPLCHYPQEHPSGPGVHKLADVETALRAMDLSASFPFEDLSKGTAAERSSNGERGQHVETPTTAATSATASKTDSTSGSECGETTTVRPTVSPTPNAAPTPTNGAGNLRLTCVRSGNTSQDVVERRCWADEHSDASDGEGDLDGVWNFGPNKAEKEDNPEHSGTGSSSGDHAPMVHDEKPPLLSLRADKGRWNSKAGPKRGKMEGPHGNGKSAGAGGKGEAKSSGTGGAEHKATSGVFAGHEKTSAGRRGPTQERYTGILKSWNHGARDKTSSRIVGYIQVDAEALAGPEFSFLSTIVPTEEKDRLRFSRLHRNREVFTPDLLVYLEDVVFARNTKENAQTLLRMIEGGEREQDTSTGRGWLPVAEQRVSFALRANDVRGGPVRKFVAAEVKAEMTGEELKIEEGKLAWSRRSWQSGHSAGGAKKYSSKKQAGQRGWGKN